LRVGTLVAAGQRAMIMEIRLLRAREALRLAKQALREAERRYDCDCSVDSKQSILRIRSAEAKVQAARAALLNIELGGIVRDDDEDIRGRTLG
jgi:hypothetical protein